MKRPKEREQDTTESKARAYARATARCAAAEQCTADWRRKFATYGLQREDIEELLDRLVDEGFIDDARYAHAYVHDKVCYDHWGPLKVRQGLAAKGIPSVDIAAALVDIPADTWDTNLRDALKAKARALGLNLSANNSLADAFDDASCEDPDEAPHDEPSSFEVQRANKQKLLRFAVSRGYAPADIFRVLDAFDA